MRKYLLILFFPKLPFAQSYERLQSLDSPRCCEGVNTCDDMVPVKGKGVWGGGGGRGQIILVHPSPNRHAIVGFFMRAIACIMFPSSHAAVGAYPRLDAVSSIIASSHSLIFLLLTSFSPESAVAASVSRSLSVSGPCFSSPFGKQLFSLISIRPPPPRRFLDVRLTDATTSASLTTCILLVPLPTSSPLPSIST